MENYQLEDLYAAEKSLASTLKKIEKAIISLEAKQAAGKNLASQITLSKEREKALKLALLLIKKEIKRKSSE